MAIIKPFQAIRPAKGKEEAIAALPYDVYNREEAEEAVKNAPISFLRIDRADIYFPKEANPYEDCVYQKAKELLDNEIINGDYIKDEKPCLYLYELIMNGRSQTGIVGCTSIDDYNNNVIKKHENTRADKELDRIHHVDILNAQTGPIFLAYRDNDKMKAVIKKVKQEKPIYHFTSEDDITHIVYKIEDKSDIDEIVGIYADMKSVYIADGHHRCASAVKVGEKRRLENPEYTGEEEFNYFLSVSFPDSELMIMDYNRVVKDLNGLSEKAFLEEIEKIFTIDCVEKEFKKPSKKGKINMFFQDKWYSLTIRREYMNSDPVKSLDVSILQNEFLSPILGIKDPKTDKRIDFVGGIRGYQELENRVHKDMKIAFAMYPTSINELFSVADASLLMPPKSTWFEPKLRSGLFIHSLS